MDGSKIIMLLGGATGLLCATAIAMAASVSAKDRSFPQGEPRTRGHIEAGDGLAWRMLAVHNAERERLRLPRLKWNRNLEREAAQWAQVLSRKGMLQHASQDARNSTGENLWMGSAGHWNVETMVGMFIDEKKHYRHGSFPDISRTGNWADVGHYTQIVWRDTQEVGCALVTARGNDVLVCRYWPAGNVWGQKAY